MKTIFIASSAQGEVAFSSEEKAESFRRLMGDGWAVRPIESDPGVIPGYRSAVKAERKAALVAVKAARVAAAKAAAAAAEAEAEAAGRAGRCPRTRAYADARREWTTPVVCAATRVAYSVDAAGVVRRVAVAAGATFEELREVLAERGAVRFGKRPLTHTERRRLSRPWAFQTDPFQRWKAAADAVAAAWPKGQAFPSEGFDAALRAEREALRALGANKTA